MFEALESLPLSWWLFFFFLFGSIWGSFANVVIVRWPEGQSVVRPRSRCPKCLTPIAWFDNIPIFSWLALRGKCRHCQQPISARYPLVELLMGLFFAAAFWRFGFSWTFVEALFFIFGLVTSSFIDLDHFLLPDVFTLSGIVIGLLGAWLNPSRSFNDALFGAIFGGGFLWALAYAYLLIRKEEGMGMGDMKLLAWIGAVLGWQNVPFVILASSVLGSLIGMAVAFRGEKGMKSVIPFGPFLALAALLILFAGEWLSKSYFEWLFPPT